MRLYLVELPEDIARRFEAARGYAGMNINEFAAAIGVGRNTLMRTEKGTRTPKDGEVREASRVSGLPIEFFIVGDLDLALGGDPHDPLVERVAALERQVVMLMRRAAGASPPSLLPPGEEPRRQAGPGQSDASDPPSEPPQAEGSG